jgi:hypothetical protein
VTELVTEIPLTLALGNRLQYGYLASVLSSRSSGLGACVQKTTPSSSRLEFLFSSRHSKEQPVGVIKQRYELVVHVEAFRSIVYLTFNQLSYRPVDEIREIVRRAFR